MLVSARGPGGRQREPHLCAGARMRPRAPGGVASGPMDMNPGLLLRGRATAALQPRNSSPWGAFHPSPGARSIS